MPVLPYMLAGGGRLLGWPFSLFIIILSSGKGGAARSWVSCMPAMINNIVSVSPAVSRGDGGNGSGAARLFYLPLSSRFGVTDIGI